MPRVRAASLSVPEPPHTKKAGRPSLSRRAQASQISSGPTPAGSPSETASGAGATSVVVFDHRVAAQVAQVALRAFAYAVVFELRLNLVAVGARGRLGIIPTA